MKTRLTAILLVLLLYLSIPQVQAAGEAVTVSATPGVINSSTNATVQYTLTSVDSGQVSLRINDPDNHAVLLIDEGVKNSGTYSATWGGTYLNGTAVPDGIYEVSVRSLSEGSLLIPYLSQWGSKGAGPGQFSYPWGIAVSPTGKIYVADRDNNRVQMYNSPGSFAGQWGGTGAANGKFYSPWGIAVNSTGYVYVTDRNNCRVQVFDANGSFVTKWGSPGTDKGKFYYPEGIAVNSTGFVYVADTYNNRVQVFDPLGKYVAEWTISNPRGLAVNSTDYLYVVSGNNHQVQIFDSGNKYAGGWGTQGTGDGQLSNPWGIATDIAGHVYVSDVRNYRVQVFDSGGRYLARFGSAAAGGVQLSYPTGIGTAPDGHIYVVDTSNSRVVAYRLSNSVEETCGNAQIIVDNTPPEIAINSPAGFYLLNQPVTADWSATDSLSGLVATSGTTSPGASIDTSTPGSHTYRVMATDRAGNTYEEVVTYSVGYQFQGLLPPAGKGENASFKQGSAIPVKFRLADANGKPVAGAASSLNLSKMVNGAWGPEQAAGAKGKAGTADNFRYDQASDQYIYNLDTKPLSPGMWRLIIKLDDGTAHGETIRLA